MLVKLLVHLVVIVSCCWCGEWGAEFHHHENETLYNLFMKKIKVTRDLKVPAVDNLGKHPALTSKNRRIIYNLFVDKRQQNFTLSI